MLPGHHRIGGCVARLLMDRAQRRHAGLVRMVEAFDVLVKELEAAR